MQLDRRLNFGAHLQIAIAKTIRCVANLTWLMPNIGGPREAKRRLVAKQGGAALRIVSAYRAVSTSAVLVLASVLPIDFQIERQETL